MSKTDKAPGADSEDDMPGLDEEFLMRVDRAMLACKQSDSHRLAQVRRAAEEEARLANMTNAHGLEQRSGYTRNDMK
ncbi:hypothetical protein [Variovorax paradoxus]|uniref:hypothetical protein n=1 Tax=Variovorax paradoxus TaxID=34073 RepID=UPI003ED07A84